MSMVYDVIFMVQHYCLFAGSADGQQHYATVSELEEAGDAAEQLQGAAAATTPRKTRG